ncbi:MAG: glycerol kinase GlpK [Pseudomonadota bacterium]
MSTQACGYVLAIDQGTTSSRALVFDGAMAIVGVGQEEFPQHFPADGWVEHDAEDIWETTVRVCRAAIADAGIDAGAIAALGITNQRETTVVWDRETGRPIYNALVWQDRRTSSVCARLRSDGCEPIVTAKTGLLLDPYFSATKIAWLLDNVDGARAAAEAGKLACGTIDSFLLWRLTGGAQGHAPGAEGCQPVHATDATNASRTMLYDIERGRWDDELLSLFGVPSSLLPEVRDSNGDFGVTDPLLFGAAIPIRGVAGDQQAAALGQACFEPGMIKSTYGTGCFMLAHTGDKRLHSDSRLLSTIAARLDGVTTFALEGSIFMAGATVHWLRDGLRLIADASEADALARDADDTHHVYLVPAFTGLGAPYWDAEARGAIFGLTRATGAAELTRAALEAVCYQTRDLLDAMVADGVDVSRSKLRVDGGMVASDWTMQFLAEILDMPVDRPPVLETTALGAAWLAGSKAGLYPDRQAFAEMWRSETQFTPRRDEVWRDARLARWHDAIARTRSLC